VVPFTGYSIPFGTEVPSMMGKLRATPPPSPFGESGRGGTASEGRTPEVFTTRRSVLRSLKCPSSKRLLVRQEWEPTS
jgi:hypothetical protein